MADVGEGDGEEQGPDGDEKAALSRSRVIAAAVTLIDSEGLAALSMRRLAGRLGVDAMALYRYVNGREDLLEGVIDSLTDELTAHGEHPLGPDHGWQAVLQWLAHSVRAVAVEHPMIFPLLATRHPAAPWVRPPLRSLRVVDDFLQALTDRGFTDRQAVSTYRVFTSFLLGTLLLEATVRGGETAPVEEALNEGGADLPTRGTGVDLADYPALARTADLLADDHAESEFEEALEALLDRLDRELSQ